MRRLIQEFIHNCKGAVTVFVTLLLIPAVLISGTAVDVARIYAARSTVQDGNQMAANSVLTTYDALLQDLYGLYGVAKDDPELASMVDQYVKLAVFGENWQKNGLGSFQLFYGSDLDTQDIQPAPGQTLENLQVMRRQIEEYAKYRAPVVVVEEILDKLEVFDKVVEDAGIIKDKMDIDDKVEDINKIYRKIYECIQVVNAGESVILNATNAANSYIDKLQETFGDLYKTRKDEWQHTFDHPDSISDDRLKEYEKKYDLLFDQLHALINGGTLRWNYVVGNLDENGKYVQGKFQEEAKNTTGWIRSRNHHCDLMKELVSDQTLDFKNDTLSDLLKLAKDADKKRQELSTMVDNLEKKLKSGTGSKELRDGLTKPRKTATGEQKSQIEIYRSLLSYNITEMAQAMYDHDSAAVDDTITILHDNWGYGNTNAGNGYLLHPENILDIDARAPGYQIDLELRNRELPEGQKITDTLKTMATLTPIKFANLQSYEKFQSDVFKRTKNGEFYRELEKLYGSDGNDTKKKNVIKSIEQVAGCIQNEFKEFVTFDPLGAHVLSGGGDSSTDDNKGFGTEGDWSGGGAAKDETKKALNNDLLTTISNAGNKAANKLLLLTYDTEMFSCYATNAGYSGSEEEQKEEPTEKTMTGIPMGVDVNYYFQSELEYLYHGNLSDAKANLVAVAGTIFLIRFVLNYSISFTISDVNQSVHTVEEALAFLGPGAIAVGELVRLVMALGESVQDVGRLKQGCTVALMKNSDTWSFSLSGLLGDITSGAIKNASDISFPSSSKKDDSSGLKYKDYIRLLLLIRDGDTLAQRTANLVELNVTNYRDKIGDLGDRAAREAAMSKAKRFDCGNMMTGFSLTSTVNLRMLFLSMPFARISKDGGEITPPGTVAISVTDYRGY